MRLGDIARPDGGCQAVNVVVGGLQHFVYILKRNGADDRTKYFFIHHFHARLGVDQHGWLHEIAPVAVAPAPRNWFCPFTLPRFEEAYHPFELLLGNERSHLRIGILTGAELDLFGRGGHPFDHLIEMLLMNKQPRAGAAALAMIEEDRVRRTGDGRIEIGIFEHNIRRLAAELERDFLQVVGSGSHDQLAHFGRAGESDLVDIRMRGQRGAGRFAEAGDDIHHTIWNARLLHQLAKPQRAERSLLRRFEHDRATSGQRRPQLPSRHQERKIPRDNLPDHSDRLALGIGEELRARRIRHTDRHRVSIDFGCPAGHVAEEIDRQRHIGNLRPVSYTHLTLPTNREV